MLEDWQYEKLGRIASFKTGKLDSNAATSNGEYPFFTCSRETFRTNTFSFDTECVLLAGNNANGTYPLKFYKGKFDAYQRTYVIRTLDAQKVINKYLYYSLQLQLDLLRQISTGSATKFLTLTILNDLDVALPPLPVQCKIATVLSAYDDLIENNTRRIKILEEMAQMLYREWFVDFRFPGHEQSKIIETAQGPLPEGWKATKLSDVAVLVMGQSPTSDLYNLQKNGLPFHQGVADFGSRFPSDRVYTTALNRIAEKGDILFSVRAPVGRINISTKKIVIGRGVSAIRSKSDRQCFLFQQLKDTFQEEDSMGNGAIFKSVTKEDMQGIPLLAPSSDVVLKFENLVRPVFRHLEILSGKNAILGETRDLLLPKLISGEVDVADLEIAGL